MELFCQFIQSTPVEDLDLVALNLDHLIILELA
jgi:hypothetical protein